MKIRTQRESLILTLWPRAPPDVNISVPLCRRSLSVVNLLPLLSVCSLNVLIYPWTQQIPVVSSRVSHLHTPPPHTEEGVGRAECEEKLSLAGAAGPLHLMALLLRAHCHQHPPQVPHGIWVHGPYRHQRQRAEPGPLVPLPLSR